MSVPIMGSNRELNVNEPRLGVCHVCNKIERLTPVPSDIRRVPATIRTESGAEYTYKDPQGSTIMVPEYDPVGEDFVGRHTHGLPDTAIDSISFFPVDPATWNKVDVVSELKKELQQVTSEFYEESTYYKDEAIKCFNAHHNPKDSCPDFKSDAKKIGPNVRPQHQMFLCYMCFTGDTEVITRQGTKTFWELLNGLPSGRAELLVPNDRGPCSWKDVKVRSYGEAEVATVTLRKGRTSKTIRATEDHRWSVAGDFVFTKDLQPGMRLDSGYTASLFCSGSEVVPSPQGVAHGIVYGDGTNGTGNRPKVWKQAPDLMESRGYLLGWLAGYFAADGHVAHSGQATIESASKVSIQLVKDVCYILGVHASPINFRTRTGIRGFVGDLHRVTITSTDLPDSFWLKTKHYERVMARKGAAKRVRKVWEVQSVEWTGDVEEVFCAEVPGVEKFVLADNLLTGNCPFYHGKVVTEQRWKRGWYDPKNSRRLTAARDRAITQGVKKV